MGSVDQFLKKNSISINYCPPQINNFFLRGSLPQAIDPLPNNNNNNKNNNNNNKNNNNNNNNNKIIIIIIIIIKARR